MTHRPTTLERAYELARTGDFNQPSEIQSRLKEEGYIDAEAQMIGPILRRDLRFLCQTARAAKGEI
jgi:hypothetical protein